MKITEDLRRVAEGSLAQQDTGALSRVIRRIVDEEPVVAPLDVAAFNSSI